MNHRQNQSGRTTRNSKAGSMRGSRRLRAMVTAGLASAFLVPMAGGSTGAQAQVPRDICGPAVTVQPGDTMAAIAAQCGISLEALRRVNPGLDAGRLRIGERIAIPGHAMSAPISDDPVETARRQPVTYVVQSGDTLANIAQRFDTTVQAFEISNPELRNQTFLRLGQELQVPGTLAEPSWGEPDQGRLQVTGTLSSESVECPTLRGDNGQLYSLAGGIGNFAPGDRVRVTGRAADMSICMQGTTISVASIEELDGYGYGQTGFGSNERGTPGLRRPSANESWSPPPYRLVGFLTNEGDVCPTLRSGSGELFSLQGEIGRFGPGDTVYIEGRPAFDSRCRTGTPVQISRIERR